MVYCIKEFWGAWKKKNKSTDVIWRGFDAICVCPLIDHGQQPMKMHTEVTLLYNVKYIILNLQSIPWDLENKGLCGHVGGKQNHK